MNKKAVVLLSGGIDSATCLALAVEKYGKESVVGLSLRYGQKHIREIESSRKVAQFYGIDHIERDLDSIYDYSDCTLLSGNADIKHQSYSKQLGDLEGEGTVDTYVPFRNGLFLAVASAIALSVKAEVIYYGAHADDAAGRVYPDCTPEFKDAMNKAIYEGSGRLLKIEAPLLHMNKAEVVKTGVELKAPYELTWSCYEGLQNPCGECGTCIDRKTAFEINGLIDPAN